MTTFTPAQIQFFESLGPRLTTLETTLTNFSVPEDVKVAIHDACVTTLKVALNAQLSELEGRLIQYMKTLETSISARVKTLETRTPAHKSHVKLKDPPKFGGKRDECRSFFAHLSIHFGHYPKEFENDSAKIMFAISYLEGQPFKSMEPYLAELSSDPDDTPDILSDFEVFKKTITNSYGIVNAAATAAAKIKLLKQTTSVVAYSTEFRTLMLDLNWNSGAYANQFESGLKDAITDVLVNEAPIQDLEKLITRASEIDERQTARYLSKKMHGSTLTPGPRRFPASAATTPAAPSRAPTVSFSKPEPMELGQVRKLSEADKQYRRDNNLCLYCGANDHLRAKCPVAPSRPGLASLEDNEVFYNLEKEIA